MKKRLIGIVCVAILLCVAISSASFGAEEGTGSKIKSFWRKLFNYPANVTKESASVVTETGKKGVDVIAKEVKTIGEVTSGDLEKTQNLVTEPLTGTAETAVEAVEGTVNVPAEAAKEESK